MNALQQYLLWKTFPEPGIIFQHLKVNQVLKNHWKSFDDFIGLRQY